MDIQQLRSSIFELYAPLEDQRQYLVFDHARGNLLIDVPPFSERALRLLRGTGPAGLLLLTNRARAADAHLYRDSLGVQIAVHSDDADAVVGGPDVVIGDDELLRPDARALRLKGPGGAGESEGATVVMLRKAGGVLVVGDLDLASDAARPLLQLEFSAILSSGRPPVWNAGKDLVLRAQEELPRQRRRFGILLDAPWHKAYRGRLENLMTPNPIVPVEETSEREAAMGPTTLVVSQTTRNKQAQTRRPEQG